MFEFISQNPNKVFEYLKILCTSSKEIILICEKIKADIQSMIDKRELENTEKNLERIKNYCKTHKQSKSCLTLKSLAFKVGFLKEADESLSVEERIDQIVNYCKENQTAPHCATLQTLFSKAREELKTDPFKIMDTLKDFCVINKTTDPICKIGYLILLKSVRAAKLAGKIK